MKSGRLFRHLKQAAHLSGQRWGRGGIVTVLGPSPLKFQAAPRARLSWGLWGTGMDTKPSGFAVKAQQVGTGPRRKDLLPWKPLATTKALPACGTDFQS